MGVNFELLKTENSMTLDELDNLHTGSLLKRLKHLRSMQVSYDESDWSPEERDAVENAGMIAFKKSDRWRAAYRDVKELLSGRENLPRGSKKQRQIVARLKKNR